MATSVFTVTTRAESPLDASQPGAARGISNFLTLQSFTNFAAMAGAISAAWHALRQLEPALATLWVPYGFAFAWGAISLVMSWSGLRRERQPGTLLSAAFIAVVNALVLAGAVVGTDAAFVAPR